MTVVDIGANIGFYTKLLARLVGISGHVYAFEPNQENCSRLRNNVYKLSNVSVVQAAVGDFTGQIGLFLSENLNVDHHTYDSNERRNRVDVPVVRLDDYFRDDQNVDFMKIDVQGFEYRVLMGARRILTKNPNVLVIMEFWPYGLRKASTEPCNLLDLITSLGFSFSSINEYEDYIFNSDNLDPSQADQYTSLLLKKSTAY
jgi:FkbM family methyltransferase